MARRRVSPYDPARKAVLDLIRQPIYDSQSVTAAAPQAEIRFFSQNTAGSVGLNRCNLTQTGQIGNPKVFWTHGFRFHPAQNVAVLDTTAAQFAAVLAMVENYTFRLEIGSKPYLEVPLFYLPSGLGVNLQAAGAGAEATDEFLYTNQMGVPHHGNFFKIPKSLVIPIPPGQPFEGLMRNSGGVANLGVGASNRLVYFLLEGIYGREVQ